MSKTREDFTDAELKKIHAELESAETVSGREGVYKRAGAKRQAFAQWFRSAGLPKLSEAKAEASGGEPKKRGRKPGSGAGAAAGMVKRGPGRPAGKAKGPAVVARRKPGRPVGSRNATSKASSKASGLGQLSVEAKEILIRLLAKLLDE